MRTESGEYPTSVEIQYSEDFKSYKSLEKAFDVVFGENGVAKISIPEIKCVEIRIVVKKFVKWPAFRFEILYMDAKYQMFLEAAKKMKEKVKSKNTKETVGASVVKGGSSFSSSSSTSSSSSSSSSRVVSSNSNSKVVERPVEPIVREKVEKRV